MIRPFLYITLLLVFISQAAAVLPYWLQPDFVRQYESSPYQTDLIEDCSDESYILEIKDITLTPPHPVPGEELKIEAVGLLKEPVRSDARANVLVKLGVVTLLHKDFDICDELDKNDTELKCPIEAGLIKVTQKVTLPKEIPKAHFKVRVRAYNWDDEDLACLNVDVDFRRHRRDFNKHRLIGY
ncbi:ML domain-containing protein [Zychaea mexicana]|uniref:ML domain-containing protein n=1 Tax=Zychaea mexicana TaxID=64656 RepID=UPI0022FDDFC9|nr:ML domain-containing protein [Zychaea mexicana]KAI9495518.1 ML domain-containing protein [Zychaea mexicana]